MTISELASLDAAVEPTEDEVLRVRDLQVSFRSRAGSVTVVDDVSFEIRRGEVLGLVGESGSGKTMTAMAALGLAQSKGALVAASALTFDGQDVRQLGERAWSRLRGRDVGMIFQQPTRSLNPAFTVGEQIAEVVRRHEGLSRKAAWQQAVAMLDRVQIADAAKRAQDYPHTFSGGMCQRVMIAMALACSPKLLIADEPTTALDVTVQSKVLLLLQELQRDLGVAILFITHDLGVVAEMCTRVAVMYAGQIVETAPTATLFASPEHPYSRGLIASVPLLGANARLVSIAGNVPPPHAMPPGCRFHPRCRHVVVGRCDDVVPNLERVGPDQAVRCVRVGEIPILTEEEGA